ncbi:hypothetical protein LX32DRAFT_730114 [Colletotrichum zoysiae]|uniref:MEI5 protein n=1 Tax=Colletotrichum zoysiae TaxID=1216348 RepID=A0AAD9HCT2_9PEZI|nr:hypothetical protein LX32DRAFT_730114 [Colletotrichum zoysiae]
MASQTEPFQLAESCVKLFQIISADTSFSYLQTIVVENERLRTRTADLQTAYDVNLQTLTGLQRDVAAERGRTAAKNNELEASKSTVAELNKKIEQTEAALKEKESQLTAGAEEISKLQGEFKKKEAENEQLQMALKNACSEVSKVKKAEHEAQEKIKTLRTELDKSETRLSKLDSFAVKLEPEPSGATRNQLDVIFKDSFALMRKYLGNDLANDVLSDSSRWNEVRNHPAVNRNIPVPSSNSPPAKKMRVVASLAILAFALSEHVFQPTYLLDNNELAGLLDYLTTASDFEKDMEAHLRSVLLKLCPSKHESNASERAKKASNDLIRRVGPLLPESKRDEFASALEKICQGAARCWAHVQRLVDRVDPVTRFEMTADMDAWKLMELPGMDGEPSKARGSPSPGGKKNGAQPKTQASGSSSGAVEDVVAVVWPAFILFDEQETLREGLVLKGSQVEEAKKEESSGFRSGARRMTRHNSRRQSTQNGGDAAERKAFLSGGAGGP